MCAFARDSLLINDCLPLVLKNRFPKTEGISSFEADVASAYYELVIVLVIILR